MVPQESRFHVLAQPPAPRRRGRSPIRHDVTTNLVHDALARAYERRGSFQAGSHLAVWLLAILHNVRVDASRARDALVRHLAHPGPLAGPYVSAGQDHQVRLRQARQAFIAPEEQRAALHLVAIEGLTYAEAAAALGVPVDPLRSRIAAARQAPRAIEDSDAMASTAADRRRHVKVVGGADGRLR